MTENTNEYELQAHIDDLQKALKSAHLRELRAKTRTNDLVEAVYRAAKDAAIGQPKIKPTIYTPPKRLKQKSEVAVLHATDWQLGKKTVSFGISTLDERMKQVVEKMLAITEIQRADHPVNDAVILFGGDMVEGLGIFPGQVYEVEAYLYQQLFEAVRIMKYIVASVAANFKNVKVVCEFGNHGRLGRKGEMPANDNIDAIAYGIVAQGCENLKNVLFQMSADWYQIFKIGNYNGLLVHGDEIKSFGGNTPAFGILRKVSAWSSGVIEPFHDCYMGHWHTPMSLTMANGGRIFVTGSPESHNEYAREFVAAVGKPSQRLHFVDPEKARVTSEHVLWLD